MLFFFPFSKEANLLAVIPRRVLPIWRACLGYKSQSSLAYLHGMWGLRIGQNWLLKVSFTNLFIAFLITGFANELCLQLPEIQLFIFWPAHHSESSTRLVCYNKCKLVLSVPLPLKPSLFFFWLWLCVGAEEEKWSCCPFYPHEHILTMP